MGSTAAPAPSCSPTGIGTAADGSSQIADGLGKATDAAPKLPDGAERLSREGMGQLKKAGADTATSYGEMYAVIAAGSERAHTSAMAFGAPEGAAGLTAYAFKVKGADGEGGRNVVREVRRHWCCSASVAAPSRCDDGWADPRTPWPACSGSRPATGFNPGGPPRRSRCPG